MSQQLVLGFFGAWLLLISQALLFTRLNSLFKSNGHTSDEARLFSFATVLFGSSLSLGALLFFTTPYWASQFVVAVSQLIVFRHLHKYTLLSVRQRIDLWAVTPPLLIAAWFIYIASSKLEDSIDGMLYHGPALANILTRSGLWDWSVASAYSYYTDLSLITAAQFARLTIGVQLEDLAGLPSLILLFFLIRVILAALTTDSKTKSSLGVLVLATPVIWIHTRILYVDLAYGAALCTTIYLCSRRGKLRNEVLAVGYFSAGALMAIKPAGFVIALILFGILLFRTVFSRTDKINSHLIFAMASSVLGGLSFYLRNLIEWGNPFFPVSYSFGSLRLSGLIDFQTFASDPGRPYQLFSALRLFDFGQSVWFGSINGMSKLDYDPRIGGFGRSPIFVAAIVAAVVLSTNIREFSKQIKSEKKEKTSSLKSGEAPFSVLLLTLLMFIALGLQPNSLNSRYTIGPFVIGTCLVFLSLRLLRVSFEEKHSLVPGLAILMSVSMLVWVESNVAMGYASINQQKREIVGYNEGVSSSSYQQGNAFIWLPKNECVNVYVHSGPGVTNNGNVGFSVADILTYGYFGNQLCNNVTFVSGGIPTTDGERHDLSEADFIVAFDDQRENVLALSNRCAISSWKLENPPSWMIEDQKLQIVSKMGDC